MDVVLLFRKFLNIIQVSYHILQKGMYAKQTLTDSPAFCKVD